MPAQAGIQDLSIQLHLVEKNVDAGLRRHDDGIDKGQTEHHSV